MMLNLLRPPGHPHNFYMVSRRPLGSCGRPKYSAALAPYYAAPEGLSAPANTSNKGHSAPAKVSHAGHSSAPAKASFEAASPHETEPSYAPADSQYGGHSSAHAKASNAGSFALTTASHGGPDSAAADGTPEGPSPRTDSSYAGLSFGASARPYAPAIRPALNAHAGANFEDTSHLEAQVGHGNDQHPLQGHNLHKSNGEGLPLNGQDPSLLNDRDQTAYKAFFLASGPETQPAARPALSREALFSPNREGPKADSNKALPIAPADALHDEDAPPLANQELRFSPLIPLDESEVIFNQEVPLVGHAKAQGPHYTAQTPLASAENQVAAHEANSPANSYSAEKLDPAATITIQFGDLIFAHNPLQGALIEAVLFTDYAGQRAPSLTANLKSTEAASIARSPSGLHAFEAESAAKFSSPHIGDIAHAFEENHEDPLHWGHVKVHASSAATQTVANSTEGTTAEHNEDLPNAPVDTLDDEDTGFLGASMKPLHAKPPEIIVHPQCAENPDLAATSHILPLHALSLETLVALILSTEYPFSLTLEGYQEDSKSALLGAHANGQSRFPDGHAAAPWSALFQLPEGSRAAHNKDALHQAEDGSSQSESVLLSPSQATSHEHLAETVLMLLLLGAYALTLEMLSYIMRAKNSLLGDSPSSRGGEYDWLLDINNLLGCGEAQAFWDRIQAKVKKKTLKPKFNIFYIKHVAIDPG